MATGHYCRKAEETAPDGRTIYKLLAGSDPNKDQSYFLCQLSQEQLSRALFPVGHLLKPEVRRIAEQMKLATAKRKDSQGICFVGKVDLPVFLQQKLKAKPATSTKSKPIGPNTDKPSHSSAKRRMQGWARRNERLRIKCHPTRYKSGEYGLDRMSEPGDSSDGNRRKAVLHSDGYRTGCTRCSLPLYRARRQKSGSITEPTFIPSANAKGWGSAAARSRFSYWQPT